MCLEGVSGTKSECGLIWKEWEEKMWFGRNGWDGIIFTHK